MVKLLLAFRGFVDDIRKSIVVGLVSVEMRGYRRLSVCRFIDSLGSEGREVGAVMIVSGAINLVLRIFSLFRFRVVKVEEGV